MHLLWEGVVLVGAWLMPKDPWMPGKRREDPRVGHLRVIHSGL
jgi:hypothetical protein